ncbi:hypothetical protein GCM10027262_77850 [Nocardia tengchongensis]
MTSAATRPQFDAPARTIRELDYGFFGPGSPTWKVWTAPTALIGFQRAVTLEHFDPDLTAAVADVGGIYSDPRGRLAHTFAYFLIAAVADAAYPPAVRAAMSALKSDRLKLAVARHGIGQMTGRLLAEHMRAGVPVNPVTVTPQQAKALYGRKSSSSA